MKGLSIIILSYNTKQSLKRCLESLKIEIALSLKKFKTEIIVVDNGSSDGSVELIKGYQVNKPEGLNIKLIENKENFGFAKGVNQGIGQSGGEVIFLLNSDAVIKEGALRALFSFEEKIRPAIIGARLIDIDGSVQSSVFHLPTIGRAISEYWLGKNSAFSKYYPLGEKPVEVEAIVGGAMLISRKIIDKIGLFDERYFMYFEDLDYCRRARKAGFKVYYFPSAKIVHEHGLSGRAIPTKTNQWLIESSKIYYGLINYLLITLVIWTSQKWQSFFKNR